MCEGVGAEVARKSLSPTSNRSWCFSISALLGRLVRRHEREVSAGRAPSELLDAQWRTL
jgi:hypothetical protein